MWKNGDDMNEQGDRIRLYQPIAYSSGRTLNVNNPTSSFLGGGGGNGSAAVPPTFCGQCGSVMQQLVQLHVPKTNVTYQIRGCNRAVCVNTIFNNSSSNSSQHEDDKEQKYGSSSLFNVGGGGVFQCWKMDTNMIMSKSSTKPNEQDSNGALPASKVTDQGDNQQIDNNDDNDWAVDSDDGNNKDDDDDDDDNEYLEQQIAALELRAKLKQPEEGDSRDFVSKSAKQNSKKISNNNNKSNQLDNGFPVFEIHSLLEPPGKKHQNDNKEDYDDEEDYDEEDMIGSTVTGGSSDAKIQQMLAKYMAEEEDEDILRALRGSSGNGGCTVAAAGGGGGGNTKIRGEKDERLKPSDRALLTFTDRIKRSPRQVLRYAPGGVPLWSLPRPWMAGDDVPSDSKVSFSKTASNKNKGIEIGAPAAAATVPMIIPPCPCCGSERQFEFQLMPSALHILEVDKHATAIVTCAAAADPDTTTNKSATTTTTNLEDLLNVDHGGMNWGVIAVYTCSAPISKCPSNSLTREELLVVQASVDALPSKHGGAKKKMMSNNDPVIIPEGRGFQIQTANNIDDDDDNEYLEGCNDDDDDETVGGDESDLVFTLDG